jgi:hypothetical protein
LKNKKIKTSDWKMQFEKKQKKTYEKSKVTN